MLSAMKRLPAPLNKLTDRLKDIYTAGHPAIAEELDARKVKTIKIVENNIGHTVEFDQVYTLKKAYSGFKPGNRPTPFSEIGTGKYSLSLNLNNYLQPNLEFDASKTTIEHLNHLKSISLTEGMVQQGDIIITKRELVTPEKVKILNSLKTEYQNNLGSTETYMRTIGGQFLLVLVALLVFSIFSTIPKTDFLQQPGIYIPLRFISSHHYAR